MKLMLSHGHHLGIRMISDELDKDKMKKEVQRRVRRKAARIAKEQALRDLGLTKVKGGLGGTYWE